MAQLAERKEREEQRIKDALASSKMSHRAVAEACLAWLIEQGDVGKEWTVEMVAEAVLYLIALEVLASKRMSSGSAFATRKVTLTRFATDKQEDPTSEKNAEDTKLTEKTTAESDDTTTLADTINTPNDQPQPSTLTPTPSPSTKSSSNIAEILQLYTDLSTTSMKRAQITILENLKLEFCYTACLVAVIARGVEEYSSSATSAGVDGYESVGDNDFGYSSGNGGAGGAGLGKASKDMMECLRLWRKVRLG
jgi:hypothetical protein